MGIRVNQTAASDEKRATWARQNPAGALPVSRERG
jgi:hypothetical protein